MHENFNPLRCVLQVSTHNMHSSSEDDDMESPFPNDLSLQQVGGERCTCTIPSVTMKPP